jgi:hypothetical protein
MTRSCARCGKTPPDGFASITVAGETNWYCHPDNGPDCYSQTSHENTYPFLEDLVDIKVIKP